MAAVHDAGKSVVVQELSTPGMLHETAGAQIAEQLGVPPWISKICASHSADSPENLDMEEIAVRLADKLWKGKRDAEFEKQAIKGFSSILNLDEWRIFMELDRVFQSIADMGHERLESTRALPDA